MCVLDNVIPPERIQAVRDEVDRVTREATDETAGRATHKGQADALSQNLIARMPLFREYLAHPTVLNVARQMLDDHVRMAQINLRTIRGDEGDLKGGKPKLGGYELRGLEREGWQPAGPASERPPP